MTIHPEGHSHTLPRLFVPDDLGESACVFLDEGQSHYLLSVLRCRSGDRIRVFNGRDGEWIAALETKGKRDASLRVGTLLQTQPAPSACVHLVFAPLRKDRMDFLIEKAVELGVGAFHPVLTERTENRHPNAARLHRQIIEAAEQCERLDLPVLHDPVSLPGFLGDGSLAFPVLACIERSTDPTLPCGRGEGEEVGLLIGPEGGFTPHEIAMLRRHPGIRPVSLGLRILRAETAAIYALARLDGLS